MRTAEVVNTCTALPKWRWVIESYWWPGRWGPQSMPVTGGGGPARVPNLRVCKHLLIQGWHTQGEEGRIDVLPWYRPVGVSK